MLKPTFVCPQDFGAVYDGATDDLTSVRAAIRYAQTNGDAYVYFPPGPGCAVSDTIDVPQGVMLVMDAPLTYIGAGDIPLLRVGSAGAGIERIRYRLNVRRATISPWANENSIGIMLVNLSSCDVEISQTNGFTIGLQCIGNAAGFAYTRVMLGEMMNNRIGVDLTNTSGGWCNENVFVNGRFGAYSTTNTGLSRYGVRITSQDGTYVYNNNNLFIKPSFELGQSLIGAQEAVPLLIEHGLENGFVSCRNEDNSATFARVLNESSENSFDVGYGNLGPENIDDRSDFPLSYAGSRSHKYSRTATTLIFATGALHKSACYYDGANLVNVPRVHVAADTSDAVSKAGPMKIDTNYLELADAALGIFVDTHAVKRFVLKKDAEPGYGGRVAVVCYGADGSILTGAAADGKPYVQGTSGASPYFNDAVYGGGPGGFVTGSDGTEDFYFVVHTEVSQVRLLVSGGTNPLHIRSFSVYSPDGFTAVWCGYEEIVPGVNLAIAPPAAGSWPKGRMLLNDAKEVLGPKRARYIIEGWECIGSPNEWIAKISYIDE